MSIRVLDGNGNLKVDAVDAGVATESTLTDALTALQLIDDLQGALKSQDTDELISRLVTSGGVEIDPATSDKQDTMITALQKIDDLQNALKSVDSDELITRLVDNTGSEISPATSTKQNLMITALQKIDDLQNALKSVDTDELITRLVDSSGTEIDPAKEGGNLADIKTAIEKLDDLQGALLSQDTDKLLSVLLGYDGANYQKMLTDSSGRQIVRPADGEKMWSYAGIVEENIYDGNLSGGNEAMNGTAVPSGEVWVIENITVYYYGTLPGRQMVQIDGLGNLLTIKDDSYLTNARYYRMQGPITMQAGDNVRFRMINSTAGDTAYLKYAGYKMATP
jgi:hypothetical protein